MELWIRSQSKIDLMCVRRVQYGHINNRHIIYGENITMYLGEYFTKERCLEIIDEIQNLMCKNGLILFKDAEITNLSPKDIEPFKAISFRSLGVDKKSEVTIHNAEVVVYEMPEK